MQCNAFAVAAAAAGAARCGSYVKTPGATVKAPRVRLADFARVAIAAGKTATVTLELTPKCVQ